MEGDEQRMVDIQSGGDGEGCTGPFSDRRVAKPAAIQNALAQTTARGTTGPEITPLILAHIAKVTEGPNNLEEYDAQQATG